MFYEDQLLEEDFPIKDKGRKIRRNHYYRTFKKHKRYRRWCGCDYCVSGWTHKHKRKIQTTKDILEDYEDCGYDFYWFRKWRYDYDLYESDRNRNKYSDEDYYGKYYEEYLKYINIKE